MTTLANKVALVTGGSRGLGAVIVKRLAAEGAHVALTYTNNPDKASEIAGAAQALGVRALAIEANSADPMAVAAAVALTVAELDGIDILVNNTSVLVSAPVDTCDMRTFDRTLTANVRAAFVTIQAALKHMGPGGRIINIGNLATEHAPFVVGAVYATLVGLVKGMAYELSLRGITINTVQPGPVDIVDSISVDLAKTLPGLMAVPQGDGNEGIAAMVAYLASPEANDVTGASLAIDGGFMPRVDRFKTPVFP